MIILGIETSCDDPIPNFGFVGRNIASVLNFMRNYNCKIIWDWRVQTRGSQSWFMGEK